MTTKITTDWHIGVKRGAGTTPATQVALKDFIREHLKEQLDDTDHLICGDLFNDFTVDTGEVIATYEILSDWLSKYRRRLALMRGNHDYHESAGRLSSFDLLAAVLSNQFPDLVTVAQDITEWKQFILVPHLPNNEILEIEVKRLTDVTGKVVVFHANVDNPFAAESQHSLNLTSEQVSSLVNQGNVVICGHEHQHRSMLGGKCIILGNSVPSSIADCLGNDTKLHAVADGLDIKLHHHLNLRDVFTDVNWRQIDEKDLSSYQFIRVSGDCTSDQAAEMVTAVAKLRQRSNAFVVSPAVKVEGVAQMEGLADMSMESISKFDVLRALLDDLSEREQAAVKGLLK